MPRKNVCFQTIRSIINIGMITHCITGVAEPAEGRPSRRPAAAVHANRPAITGRPPGLRAVRAAPRRAGRREPIAHRQLADGSALARRCPRAAGELWEAPRPPRRAGAWDAPSMLSGSLSETMGRRRGRRRPIYGRRRRPNVYCRGPAARGGAATDELCPRTVTLHVGGSAGP